MSFINILSGPGQKRVSAYLSSTRQSYLVELWWENQVELEIQPFKWLFLDVNGEWRPLKIKKTQPRAILWKSRGGVLIQRSPPRGLTSGEEMWKRKGSHTYVSKITPNHFDFLSQSLTWVLPTLGWSDNSWPRFRWSCSEALGQFLEPALVVGFSPILRVYP